MKRSLLVLLVGSLIAPASLLGQEAALDLRLEIGQATIHRATSDGGYFAVHIVRSAPSGHFLGSVGVATSRADDGFVALDVGGELRLLPEARATPLVGIGAGLLAEPEFSGLFGRATLGVEIRVATRTYARVAIQKASHDSQRGPDALVVGLTIDWPFN